jgi:hypothetical protein
MRPHMTSSAKPRPQHHRARRHVHGADLLLVDACAPVPPEPLEPRHGLRYVLGTQRRRPHDGDQREVVDQDGS